MVHPCPETHPLSKRAGLTAALVAAALAVFIIATWGPPSPAPTPPGTFSFAALGDAPYYQWEEWQYRLVLQDVNDHDLGFVIHVGDIWWRPCSEAMYARALEWQNRLRFPVIYTPGDNEWTDCWEPGSGGYPPLDRLAALRRILFADPGHSRGATRIALEPQSADTAWAEFVENALWSRDGIVFATVHVPGSRNGGETFPGRTEADTEAAARRIEAAASWVNTAFAQARGSGATAVVIVFHAEPGLDELPDDPYRSAYDPFLAVLEAQAESFGKPVLLVHGDGHTYTVDHPMTNRATGRHLDNVTRLEVPGSPQVGWVLVHVTPGPAPGFTFEPRVVPRWKYW